MALIVKGQTPSEICDAYLSLRLRDLGQNTAERFDNLQKFDCEKIESKYTRLVRGVSRFVVQLKTRADPRAGSTL